MPHGRQYPKGARRYSLFVGKPLPNGRTKWKQISGFAYPIDVARRAFQDSLLADPTRQLRPIPRKKRKDYPEKIY